MIEEALKYYQNALKFHSQGPKYYHDAAKAYRTLFDSEIFAYPESIPTFALYGTQAYLEEDGDFLDGVNQVNDVAPTNANNEAPNSLPQILYLAYKNYGQFLLDRLKDKIVRSQKTASVGGSASTLDSKEIRSTVLESLDLFVEAIDRDDTDLQLWRLVAKLCEFLGSPRLAKYCLEAAMETDDGNYDTWPEPQGLDESLAAEQLQKLLGTLNDDVAEEEISTLPGRSRGLVKSLKKMVDPCPFLPTPPESPAEPSLAKLLSVSAGKEDIVVPKRTWESLGKTILLQITSIAQGLVEPAFGTAYSIILPSMTDVRPKSATSLRGGGNTASTTKILKTEDFPKAIVPLRQEAFQQGQDSLNENKTEEQDPASYGDANTLETLDDFGLEINGAGLPASPGDNLASQPTALAGAGTLAVQPLNPQTPESPKVMSLPTRKRSSETAGLPEPVDKGRSKSKRIKARVSTIDGLNDEVANQYEQALKEFVLADCALFESAGAVLSKLGVNRLGVLDTLRASISHVDQSPVDLCDVAAQDFKLMLTSWSPEKSNMFLRKFKGGDEFSGANGAQNFTAFLENSKRGSQKPPSITATISGDDGLDDFAESINQKWTFLDPLALAWIERLLSPNELGTRTDALSNSMYETQRWPESLKKIVVQILVQRDEYIYTVFRDRLDALDHQILTAAASDVIESRGGLLALQVQHIFEIHLDVYERITNPNSEVDLETRIMQLDRLGRWNALSNNAMSKRSETRENAELDQLALRFLWSSVLYVNLTDTSARDHVILCFKDLIHSLRSAGNPVISLQNNAAMPEVSIEAAEREISSLTTMDFFLGIFSSDNSDPLTIIESLEPILESLVISEGSQPGSCQDLLSVDDRQDRSDEAAFQLDSGSLPEQEYIQEPKVESMVRYLRKASLPLRLYLWQKLGSAYEVIDYHPRVLSCSFRRIELIMNHILSQDYYTSARESRQLDLLGWLRDLDALVSSNLSFVMKERSAFEFMDSDRLRASMAAMSALQRILHVYILWKDSVGVGQTPTFQPPRGSAFTNHTASMNKFEQLQVKGWMLQYMLLREAIIQEPKLCEMPGQYLLEHLNLLHDSLGLREICGLQSKQFLKLLRSEMVRHKMTSGSYTAILKDGTSNWDRDFAQVIFDLHGIKTLPSWWGLRPHGCTPDLLDRDAALELMDFVIVHANRMSIKDLAKSELKGAIDRIQGAIKLPTATIDTTFNKRSITSYLKRPINPLDMYRSFRGVIDIPSIEIKNESAAIAAKGWYFLLGHLSLAKFRAQNRTIPGPLDDLDNATIYFRQDLELGMEKWESWYRLAQVYDVKIEEYTKWNANKLNTGMEELKTLQRNAIHCYTMAVATASRANASLEDVGKVPELYYDFALRVYASSREPYSMKAFGLVDFERHFNNLQAGMYKGRPFKGMQLSGAWDFAKVLLQRAVARKPQAWASWFLLGKCLWKIHDCDIQIRGGVNQISYSEVLYAFERAVETVSERRDKEPILEPHYKLLSIVLKLVRELRLGVQTAHASLNSSSYAQKVPFTGEERDWDQYMSEVLKVLRSADKQNWHHRMAARAAHIAYDKSPMDIDSAKAAKEVLTQQIFTKTMNIQVWRPEHERAGRHFVYTTLYVNFFVDLLIQIGDTASLEALAKKIRRKAGDFIGHTNLWESICVKYLNLLRSKGDIHQSYYDRMFKTVPLELFMMNADRLDEWTHQPDFNSPIIELIRETIELKKLNIALMKASPIEDLICDAYATLYDQLLPEIIAKSNDEENRVRMRVDHVLTGPELTASNTPPPDQPGRPGDVPPTKTRVKGVTRREVQKRAEALVARSTAATAAASIIKPAEPAREPVLEPEVEEAGASTGLSPQVAPDDAPKELESSASGSVHDSADDESELSEVEDFVDAPEEAQAAASSRSRSSGASPKTNWVLEEYERQYPLQVDDEEADEGEEAAEDDGEDEDEADDKGGDSTLEQPDENTQLQDGDDVIMNEGDDED